MPLTINTNAAATTASYFLSRNNSALQKSLTRLSSGSRINKPSDDAGGLAVSMKLNGAINRLRGVSNNIQNAISFLEVQDGVLQGAAGILDRMAELKALSQDVLKNSSDIANYNDEFANLQVQLFQLGNETFNGISLFATTTTATGATAAKFDTAGSKNTISIFTSETGEAGSKVSINKSLLMSAVTLDASKVGSNFVAKEHGAANTIAFATSLAGDAMVLSDVSVGVYTQALENIATLRAENGGSVSSLNFSLEQANRNMTNLEAANGRIIDVDIAAESTRLAKYNILVQASASMLSQANVAPSAALMLLQYTSKPNSNFKG